MTKAEEIIKTLKLEKHPVEGGYFLETYRSAQKISGANLPPGYEGEHSLSTAIYFMLTPQTFSEMHRLPGDEIFHFYGGSPVEMLQLFPDGSAGRVIIGSDIKNGESPQVIVPGGIWQGSRLLPGGEFALMGTTMAPGFSYPDYETGKRGELIESYPQYAELITLLTRPPAGAAS
ncbi:MAG: cupin domain-containing protein [Candidatus Aminicenantes bacterium]|nr:cupin domain-containing protein [Candidatus Aminicenantes bacterium]